MDHAARTQSIKDISRRVAVYLFTNQIQQTAQPI